MFKRFFQQTLLKVKGGGAVARVRRTAVANIYPAGINWSPLNSGGPREDMLDLLLLMSVCSQREYLTWRTIAM